MKNTMKAGLVGLMGLAATACAGPRASDFQSAETAAARPYGFIGETQYLHAQATADNACRPGSTKLNAYRLEGALPVTQEITPQTNNIQAENPGFLDKYLFNPISNASSSVSDSVSNIGKSSEFDYARCKKDVLAEYTTAVGLMKLALEYQAENGNLELRIYDDFNATTTTEENRTQTAERDLIELLRKKNGLDLFLHNIELMYAGMARERIALNKDEAVRNDVIALVVDGIIFGYLTADKVNAAISNNQSPATTIPGNAPTPGFGGNQSN